MGVCKSVGCDKTSHVKGYCKGHYNTYINSPKFRATDRGRTYHIWYLMVDRCHNPRSQRYSYYGAIGREVTPEWRGKEGFERFLVDMGYAPKGLSLDRIDNDKGYSPDNCRWVDMKTQGMNRKDNHRLSYEGETLTVSELSRRTGICDATIRFWHKKGDNFLQQRVSQRINLGI